ncbi:hypothetical protein NEHOM01_2042 [Nematocida homosporus]|uniref:uncharacterized protein n=1 Tax=Nematocida homosporus TaxID=1912981 RepID=UPI00221F876D|nr:uncharacterized protein NEHOM01_2042 [Nematocida homosporus]KAI5187251.1 hypothetical protein NEHOM01_2042 [Nematocida homosporus]
MLNQLRRFELVLVFVLVWCLLALNSQVVATIGVSSNIMNSVLSLEELAALDFPWAKKTLEDYKNGRIKHNGLPLVSSTDENAKRLFLSGDFYLRLGIVRNGIPPDEYVGADVCLKWLTLPRRRPGIHFPRIPKNQGPNILMLYAALNQDPAHPNQIQTTINPKHENFIEGLADHAYWIENLETTNGLEILCLDETKYAELTGQKEDKSTETMKLYSLIQTKAKLQTLRRSFIFNYIHPLNTQLYCTGLNYLYDADNKTFVIINHTAVNYLGSHPLKICQVARFTFEDAVRLRYAPDDTYTIVAKDVHLEPFRKAIQRYLDVGEHRRFYRDSNKNISTFAEYAQYKELKKQNPESAKPNKEVIEIVGMIKLPKIRCTEGILGIAKTPEHVDYLSDGRNWSCTALILSEYILYYFLAYIILFILAAFCCLFFSQGLISSIFINPAQGVYGGNSLCFIFIAIATVALLAKFVYQLSTRCRCKVWALSNSMLLPLLGIAPVSVIGCLVGWIVLYRRWPSLGRHIHWILYFLSFLLLDALLIIDDHIFDEHAYWIMNSDLICESFYLFGVGLLIDLSNLRLEQEREQEQGENKKERRVSIIAIKTAKIISLFIVVLGLVGLVIWGCGLCCGASYLKTRQDRNVRWFK